MTSQPTPDATHKPRTSVQNGRLWGVRAQDWATIQEGQFAAAYHAVFDACGVGRDTRYCVDVPGSGVSP